MLSLIAVAGFVFAQAESVTRYKCVRETGERVFAADCASVGGKLVPYEIDAAQAKADEEAFARSQKRALEVHKQQQNTKDIIGKLKARCASEWADDFTMQKYCFDKQNEAWDRMLPALDRYSHATGTKEQQALAKCAGEWFDAKAGAFDFVMFEYCWERQTEAIRALR